MDRFTGFWGWSRGRSSRGGSDEDPAHAQDLARTQAELSDTSSGQGPDEDPAQVQALAGAQAQAQAELSDTSLGRGPDEDPAHVQALAGAQAEPSDPRDGGSMDRGQGPSSPYQMRGFRGRHNFRNLTYGGSNVGRTQCQGPSSPYQMRGFRGRHNFRNLKYRGSDVGRTQGQGGQNPPYRHQPRERLTRPLIPPPDEDEFPALPSSSQHSSYRISSLEARKLNGENNIEQLNRSIHELRVALETQERNLKKQQDQLKADETALQLLKMQISDPTYSPLPQTSTSPPDLPSHIEVEIKASGEMKKVGNNEFLGFLGDDNLPKSLIRNETCVEVDVLMGLKHPHVLRVYGTVDHGGHRLLLTEDVKSFRDFFHTIKDKRGSQDWCTTFMTVFRFGML